MFLLCFDVPYCGMCIAVSGFHLLPPRLYRLVIGIEAHFLLDDLLDLYIEM